MGRWAVTSDGKSENVEDLVVKTAPPSTPPVSIIIPWCARPELATTLEANHALIASSGAELIVVISGDTERHLLDVLSSVDTRRLRIECLNDSEFNKSRALNVGIFRARSNRIFVLDADMVLSPNFVTEAMSCLDGSTFCTGKWVQELELGEPMQWLFPLFQSAVKGTRIKSVLRRVIVEIVYDDDFALNQIVYKENLTTGQRGGPGFLLAEKHHLVEIGGFNSRVSTWGWEDNDIQLRLCQVLGLRRHEIGEAIHLSHPDSTRAVPAEGKRHSEESNFAYFCSQYGKGNFLGTYHEDIKSIEVPRSPNVPPQKF